LIGKGGWVAGKTGQTPGAGNCLASLYQNDDSFYFIVVLGCKNRDLRFVESEKILLKALETKTL
jgi:D-alanyl-D-alanine carboxypeptidase